MIPITLVAANVAPVAIATPVAAPGAPVAARVVRVEGETTDGKHRSYPADAGGLPVILLVGLDREAAESTAKWSDELERRAGDRDVIVSVAVLDDVPRFVRGWIKRRIDRAVGPPAPEKAAFLTTFDAAASRDLRPSVDPA